MENKNMAVYSPEEILEIMSRLSEGPQSQIKYKKFERLGVLMEPKDEPVIEQGNNCSFCKKILPTAHLLDLHVSENHDSYFQVKKEKQPMYACYLKACKVMSFTPSERKDHCITHHHFPAKFRFDNAFSSTSKPPSPTPVDENEPENSNAAKMDTSEETANAKMKPVNGRQLVSAPVPQVKFGWHTKKSFDSGGFKKKGHKKAANGHSATPMDTMNEDLKDALPDPDEVDLVPEMDASRPSWLDEKPNY